MKCTKESIWHVPLEEIRQDGYMHIHCMNLLISAKRRNKKQMKKMEGGLFWVYLFVKFWLFFFYSYFIYLFIFSCVGSSFHAKAFSSCSKRGPLFIVVRGPLFIAVRGPLTIAAPPIAGHRLQTRRLSSCGSRAQLLGGMWDLPRPGLEPVSPALAGRFSTTVPPGKPQVLTFEPCKCLIFPQIKRK